MMDKDKVILLINWIKTLNNEVDTLHKVFSDYMQKENEKEGAQWLSFRLKLKQISEFYNELIKSLINCDIYQDGVKKGKEGGEFK